MSKIKDWLVKHEKGIKKDRFSTIRTCSQDRL